MGLSFRRSKVFRKSLIDLKILLNPHITSEIPITKMNFSKKNFHCGCSKKIFVGQYQRKNMGDITGHFMCNHNVIEICFGTACNFGKNDSDDGANDKI